MDKENLWKLLKKKWMFNQFNPLKWISEHGLNMVSCFKKIVIKTWDFTPGLISYPEYKSCGAHDTKWGWTTTKIS